MSTFICHCLAVMEPNDEGLARGVNHDTITLTERGAHVVADVMNELLTNQVLEVRA